VIPASALPWVLLGLAPGGCGDDGSISVHFTSGTVSKTARCSGNRGEFPLTQSDGLSVRGSNESAGIRAAEIEIGP